MCIMWCSRLVRERKQAITAWLSQRQVMQQLLQVSPQMAPAKTIGRSSFTIMGRWEDRVSHCSWNHSCPNHAPQPQEPDASDPICRWGRSLGGGRKDIPFQSSTNIIHHIRSDLKERLRQIGCGRDGCMGTPCRRLSIRLRKERPGRTTLQAWFSVPIRDSSSRRSHTFLSPHSDRRSRRRRSLSWERRSWKATVSISMPR